MKAKPLSIAAWVAAIGITSALLWHVFRPAAVPCDVVVVDRGPLVVTVNEDGRTRLKDRYVVSAPLGGLAERVTLKPGDAVSAGETVLVRILPVDPELLDDRAKAQAEARVRASEAAVQRAQPELARAEAELLHVRGEMERLETAAKAAAASTEEIEDERIMLRTAEHAAEAARFSLEMARYELEQSRAALLQSTGGGGSAGERAFEVRSPVSGKVLRVIRESAGVVAPGDAVLEVGSLGALEIEVDVLSDQAVRVRPGQRVILERWGGARPLTGAVRLVEPSGYTKVSALGVEEQRVNVIIDFEDPPEARGALGDGFRVEARIVVLEKADVTRVPAGAIFPHAGGWGAYVVDGGRARLREVAIGERSDRVAEVVSGLAAGDRVIEFPSDRVMEGVRVRERGR